MENTRPQFEPHALKSWYPHMGPEDARLWHLFVKGHPDYWDTVAYDVAVGGGAEFNTVVSPTTGGDIGRLYRRRIDVVAVNERGIWIVEVKPRASTSSLGQVKGYAKLFTKEFEPSLPVFPLIITDMLLPDMEVLAKEENVNLIVV